MRKSLGWDSHSGLAKSVVMSSAEGAVVFMVAAMMDVIVVILSG